MNGTQQFDINNIAACFQSVSHWGHTTYYNLCNGSSIDLDWGIGPWLGWGFLASLILAVLGFATFLFYFARAESRAWVSRKRFDEVLDALVKANPSTRRSYYQ